MGTTGVGAAERNLTQSWSLNTYFLIGSQAVNNHLFLLKIIHLMLSCVQKSPLDVKNTAISETKLGRNKILFFLTKILGICTFAERISLSGKVVPQVKA